jgi:hypothetical protein
MLLPRKSEQIEMKRKEIMNSQWPIITRKKLWVSEDITDDQTFQQSFDYSQFIIQHCFYQRNILKITCGSKFGDTIFADM